MTKTLVAYFSATGTTMNVATRLARVAGGDLFAIVPANPHTQAPTSTGATNRAAARSRPPIPPAAPS